MRGNAKALPFKVCTNWFLPSAPLKRHFILFDWNVSKFEVLLNGLVIASKRSYFGNSLNVSFDFEDGLALVATDVVLIRTIHNRPTLANYEGNIILIEGV